SAVLVGHECKTMNLACKADDSSPVILMSSGALSAVYQQAFGLLGIPYQTVDSKTAAQAGLFAIFQRLQDA
ncbi:MAG: 2-dehydro-3-deoxygalactonokinase, partial [Pseudomonadota bacterium]|nr:2-dehydro-3-deoxygalactonokinase [Pseudomonadota bacterium]